MSNLDGFFIKLHAKKADGCFIRLSKDLSTAWAFAAKESMLDILFGANVDIRMLPKK